MPFVVLCMSVLFRSLALLGVECRWLVVVSSSSKMVARIVNMLASTRILLHCFSDPRCDGVCSVYRLPCFVFVFR